MNTVDILCRLFSAAAGSAKLLLLTALFCLVCSATDGLSVMQDIVANLPGRPERNSSGA